MKYNLALQKALELKVGLAGGCKRIEIVGSVKRHDKDECGDIEILCIADQRTPRPVFGDKNSPVTMLEKFIRVIQEENLIGPAKLNGKKLKKFPILNTGELNTFYLEIYIVQFETWAIQNVIRTGPALFSRSFVTNKSYNFYDEKTNSIFHGLLPDRYEYLEGQTKIREGETILELKEEMDAIALLDLGWIPPEKRKDYIKSMTNVTA